MTDCIEPVSSNYLGLGLGTYLFQIFIKRCTILPFIYMYVYAMIGVLIAFPHPHFWISGETFVAYPLGGESAGSSQT